MFGHPADIFKNMHTQIFIVFLASGIFFCSQILIAQDRLSNPLAPAKFQGADQIGILFGAGLTQQSGSFTTSCNCEFSNGSAQNGFLTAIFYEYPLNRTFSLGFRFGYEKRRVSSSFREYENDTLIQQSTSQRTLQPILYRDQSDASFGILSFMPYLDWSPTKGIFFQIGLMPQYIFQSHLTYVKELAQQTVTFPNGEIAAIQLVNSDRTKQIIEDGDFPKVNSFQFAFAGSVGGLIKVRTGIILSPIVEYVLPMTNISEQGKNFKLFSTHFLLGAKFNI